MLTGTSLASFWVLGPITLNIFKHECTAGTHWNFIKTLKGPTVKNSSQQHWYGHFLSRRWIWKCYLQNVSHFIQAPMCKLTEAEWRIYVGSDNGLLPGQHQVIIWTSAEILLIELLVANFSEIFFKIHIFSFKKICISTGRLQNGSHFVSDSMCSCR